MTARLLAAAILSMNLHNLTDAEDLDVTLTKRAMMDDRWNDSSKLPATVRFASTSSVYAWATTTISGPMFWTAMPPGFQGHGIFDKQTADLPPECSGKETARPMTLYKTSGTEPQ